MVVCSPCAVAIISASVALSTRDALSRLAPLPRDVVVPCPRSTRPGTVGAGASLVDAVDSNGVRCTARDASRSANARARARSATSSERRASPASASRRTVSREQTRPRLFEAALEEVARHQGRAQPFQRLDPFLCCRDGLLRPAERVERPRAPLEHLDATIHREHRRRRKGAVEGLHRLGVSSGGEVHHPLHARERRVLPGIAGHRQRGGDRALRLGHALHLDEARSLLDERQRQVSMLR